MKAVKFLIYLFLGFVVGYSLFYLLLPDHMVAQLFNFTDKDNREHKQQCSLKCSKTLIHFSNTWK